MELNSCISIYPTPGSVTQALGELQTAGSDLRQVSIIGKGCHGTAHPIGFYRMAGHIRYCGCQGEFWDEVWGRLPGAAFFLVPGFGLLAAAGRVVPLMIRGLDGVELDGGFSVPGVALHGIGVPRSSIREYELAIKTEKLLLLVHGERRDVERACAILHCDTQQVTVHSA